MDAKATSKVVPFGRNRLKLVPARSNLTLTRHQVWMIKMLLNQDCDFQDISRVVGLPPDVVEDISYGKACRVANL